MDWLHILEILITSITAIVVALIGAGMFKKVTERKEKIKNKEKLIDQIKKDEIIHIAIREIRRKYNADRVYIWQFHNGGTFYTTSPIQKMSITYERCSEGLGRVSERAQDILISKYSNYINDVINQKVYYSNINQLPDIGLRSLASSIGTKAHVASPIYDKNNHLIGMLCLDWSFNNIPSEYLKKDGHFTQDFIDEFSKNADTLDNYF